jgi:CheY-like chemotaxis protein
MGLQALMLVDVEPFNLIVSDNQIPKMTGYERTRVIRERERERGSHMLAPSSPNDSSKPSGACVTWDSNRSSLPKARSLWRAGIAGRANVSARQAAQRAGREPCRSDLKLTHYPWIRSSAWGRCR